MFDWWETHLKYLETCDTICCSCPWLERCRIYYRRWDGRED